jgi:hypothetical protein
VVIFGFAALGIDIARLAFVATEVQTVADAAARGGAQRLGELGGAPTAGITRGHQIANMNSMNGDNVLNPDVDIDEGFYSAANRKFECCTSNAPCCSGQQTMYDWSCVAAGALCATGKRAAVLAVPHKQVQNILAGVIGSPTSTIDKVAVASLTGPSTGCAAPAGCAGNDWGCYCSHGVAPCLPIGVPSCQFPNPCDDAPGACQLPPVNMGSPSGDTAAWTGFQSGHSTSDIRGYLDQAPLCDPPGSYTPPGEQGLFGSNNTIDVTNGVTGNGGNNPFNVMKCIFDSNLGCSLDNAGNFGNKFHDSYISSIKSPGLFNKSLFSQNYLFFYCLFHSAGQHGFFYTRKNRLPQIVENIFLRIPLVIKSYTAGNVVSGVL